MVRKPRGFTLVELLVVISIIGMLAALLLPAVQAAREAARSATCTNNMRQWALATINFETSKGYFPGYSNDVGYQIAPWTVPLLPYIDQEPIYNLWYEKPASPNPYDPDVEMTLPQFRLSPFMRTLYCPSALSPETTIPVTTTVANAGFMPISGTDPPGKDNAFIADRAANGIFVQRSQREWAALGASGPMAKCAASDVIDGNSNTLLFSENMATPTGQPYRFWTMNGKGSGWRSKSGTLHAKGYNVFVFLYVSEVPNVLPALSAPSPPPVQSLQRAMLINGEKDTYDLLVETMRPSAEHPNGVNVAFADGHTIFLNEKIPYYVYQQLMTPNHIRSDAPYNDYTMQGGILEQ